MADEMVRDIEETVVLIVGAGPAGLATSACLNKLHIPNVLLDREDCYASLWKKRAYDRLKLHLAKEFCHLPHMHFPYCTPTYVPKDDFVRYLDQYVKHFGVSARLLRSLEYADYDEKRGLWNVLVNNMVSNVQEVYKAQFLVVATGENDEPLIPEVAGLESFGGEYMHSSRYVNGERFAGKHVLVVGSGNSGMEIAYDLSNWGAVTSISIRSPVHILSKDIVHMGMVLLKFLPCKLVDKICLASSKVKYGSLSPYGLRRPGKGPFYIRAAGGRSPTIDVGCLQKIKTGEIDVLPSIKRVEGNRVEFMNEENLLFFDAIVFATGYKSAVKSWLKNDGDLFGENGMPKRRFPNHWKGENGLYCAGFSRRGLSGISRDAKKIAKDILSQSEIL